MSAQFSTLGGIRCVWSTIAVPTFGIWTADVGIATSDSVPDLTSITFGNVTMACAVFRGADYGGQRIVRLVGGFGGWRKLVPARQYQLSGGVKLGLVVKDAAAEVGEKVNVPADRVLGPFFVRENKPASQVLRQVAGSDWYVDANGVTQIQAWPAKKVTSSLVVEDYDPASGRVTVATEDYAAFMPNCTFSASNLPAPVTSGGTVFRFDEQGKGRVEVLAA